MIGASRKHGPRKSAIAALSALSILAILMRYPQDHEIGVDSFFVHALAAAIASTGSMAWLINPLSYFGLAPFSYSPAVPVSLASFTQLAGLDIEPAILVYSLVLGLLTPWVGFLFGRAAVHHEGVSLLFAFLLTTAQGMVTFTDWTLSTRGTFLVFAPLALAFFVKAVIGRRQSRTALLALVLVLSVLTLVHALWLLLIPLLVAAWLVLRLALTEESMLRRKFSMAARSRIVLAGGIVACLTLFAFLEFGPPSTRILSGLPQLEGGTIPSTTALDIGLQIGTVVGIGIVLLPFGIRRMLMISEGARRYALLGLAVVFLPISLDPVYGVALATPFLLLISALALAPRAISNRTIDSRKPLALIAVGVMVSALTVAAPALVTIPRTSGLECQQSFYIDRQTYDAGLYTKYLMSPNSTFAWDDGVEAARIEAISGIPSLEPLESLGLLEYPWLAQKVTVHLTLEPDLLNALVKNHRLLRANEWLPAAGMSYEYYWGKDTFVLLLNNPDSFAATQILSFYNAKYAVERCSASGDVFFSGLNTSNYVVYADELQRIYSL